MKSIFKKTTVEDIDKISIDDLTEEEIEAILSDKSLDQQYEMSVDQANEKLIIENLKKKEFNE